jgi:uncharacterized coiled-coil DUF342 family protein
MSGEEIGSVLRRLSDGQQELIDTVTRLEHTVGAGRLPERVANLEGILERVEAGQNRLSADLMARIDRLQEGITQLQSEVVVNWGNTDRVDRKAQSAHDELTAVMKMVSEMLRMMRRLESRVATLEEGSPP